MKLRNKILIGIGLLWLIFLTATYLGSRFFLIQSFLKLEQAQESRNLKRIDEALNQISYSLSTFTTDWAHWNDLYSYMQGKNPDFVKNNFSMPAFVNSTINYLVYLDNHGNMRTGVAIDTDQQKYVLLPEALKKYISPDSILLSDPSHQQNIRGYVLVNDRVMLIARNTISDGNNSKPPLGVIITGRYLSPSIVKKISTATELTIELFVPSQIEKNPALQTAFQKAAATGHFYYPVNENKLLGYTIIRDINTKPIALFQSTTTRAIYHSGLETVQYYLTSYILLGAVILGFMLWLLRALILKRLERLANEVSHINTKNSLSYRVDDSGHDELSHVAKKINAMMALVQASHENLEQRVEERTQALQTINLQLQQEIIERQTVERELIIHKEHLVKLAHYDHLTSLPNRIFFNDILNKALGHAERHHKKLAVLFIDLDHFKKVNDVLGHSKGDLVLQEISQRFSAALRAGDILARLGGDEFIVLLNDISHHKFAGTVAEKLLTVSAQAVRIDKHEFFISASIGICCFPEDGTSLEDLQKHADMAMYKAKHQGGKTYQYFTHDMNIEAHEFLKLETALRKAIQNKEFVLYYQPKLNLEDGLIGGVEALIRWESPELGIINPSKFIPLAEETGLILDIGEWALREACTTNKKWQNQGYQPITVAVNISPKQFKHQNIAELIAKILEDTQLEPQYLELEITETAMMDDIDTAIERLREIKNMGIQIAIDDFGTGYTSINYLKQLPISVLKIDQNFVKGIPHNQNDNAITTAVIALGHSLGLKVVAEGVETAEQLQFLVALGCNVVQGYFFSRPLSEGKVVLQFAKLEII